MTILGFHSWVPPRVVEARTTSPVTGVTAKTSLLTLAIPGGSVGPNGSIELVYHVSSGGGSASVVTVEFGGSAVHTPSLDAFIGNYKDIITLFNQGAVNAQRYHKRGNDTALQYGANYFADASTLAIDTSANQVIELFITPSNAGDSFTCRAKATISYGA